MLLLEKATRSCSATMKAHTEMSRAKVSSTKNLAKKAILKAASEAAKGFADKPLNFYLFVLKVMALSFLRRILHVTELSHFRWLVILFAGCRP